MPTSIFLTLSALCDDLDSAVRALEPGEAQDRFSALVQRLDAAIDRTIGFEHPVTHEEEDEMTDFHAQLALDYFQARPANERTVETLRGIVEHVCATYALSPEESARVQEAARHEAQRRGLLREKR